MFAKISLAVIGIGAVKPSGLLASSGNIFSSRELAALTEAGAVGDMSLRFFDLQGQPVRTGLDERVIGLPLEDLARIPRVMALAGGASKTLAIKGRPAHRGDRRFRDRQIHRCAACGIARRRQGRTRNEAL